MRQKARVCGLLSDGRAQLLVGRKSACSGDCGGCGGCGEVQVLRIEAKNPVGAKKGDMVYVESEGGVVLKGAVLLYVIPLLLFLAGYLLCLGLGSWAYAVGAGAFLLGLVPAICYDRYVKKHPPVYTVMGFAE